MQPVSRSVCNRSAAHTWFDLHHGELVSRSNAYFHFLPELEREEAVAETLAGIFVYALSAAARGKLDRLTAYSLVVFFGKSCRKGRRMTGFKSTDAMSEVSLRRGHHKVHSMVDPIPIPTDRGVKVAPLRQVLADSREDSPFDNVRRDLDYADILDKEHVNLKGRRVFLFLAECHGQGDHRALARELGVTPGRVSQLKSQLAKCLGRHGYEPPATRPARALPPAQVVAVA